MEPLRAANALSKKTLYEIQYFSRDGGIARASCGAFFDTNPLIEAERSVDILFVVASGNPMAYSDRSVIELLRGFALRGMTLGGISGGSVLLAKAGVLENRRFTVHWEHFEELQSLSGRFLMERRLYVIDRDRYTCAGGVAPLDMMHAMIRSDYGNTLAQLVSDWFIHTGIREAHDPQRSGFAGERKRLHPSVQSALELMESHLADPLTLSQIAMLTGIGQRQLQRHFDNDFGKGIIKVYADIRLQKADELVRKTQLPFMEIAFATGFSNQSHFARAYRMKYGIAPSRSRKQEANQPHGRVNNNVA